MIICIRDKTGKNHVNILKCYDTQFLCPQLHKIFVKKKGGVRVAHTRDVISAGYPGSESSIMRL